MEVDPIRDDVIPPVLRAEEDEDQHQYTTSLHIFMVVGYSIACLGGLIGHGLSIGAVTLYKQSFRPVHAFITVVSTLEIVHMVLIMFDVSQYLDHWHFGETWCSITRTLILMCLCGVPYTLVAATGYQCLYTWRPSCLPQKYNFITTVLLSLLALVTTVCITGYIFNYTAVFGGVFCVVTTPGGFSILWYNFALCFAVPLFFLALFWMLIVVHSKRKFSNKAQQSRQLREDTRLVVASGVTYMLFMSPYWAMYPDVLYKYDNFGVYYAFYCIFCVFAQFRCIVIPVVYARSSKHFRFYICKVWRCCLGCCNCTEGIPDDDAEGIDVGEGTS